MSEFGASNIGSNLQFVTKRKLEDGLPALFLFKAKRALNFR